MGRPLLFNSAAQPFQPAYYIEAAVAEYVQKTHTHIHTRHHHHHHHHRSSSPRICDDYKPLGYTTLHVTFEKIRWPRELAGPKPKVHCLGNMAQPREAKSAESCPVPTALEQPTEHQYQPSCLLKLCTFCGMHGWDSTLKSEVGLFTITAGARNIPPGAV